MDRPAALGTIVSRNVQRLDDESIRSARRKDVLKYLFGTSILGLVCGIGGLAIGIAKLVAG